MPRIVVIGGGVVGFSMAMTLAKQGHEVTVLERDGGDVPGLPDEAWQAWNRRGVAQFRQPHYLHAAGRQILDAALPEVTQTLLAAGAAASDLLTLMPSFIEDRAPREADERFVTVTGRRPVIEYAVATGLGTQPVAEEAEDSGFTYYTRYFRSADGAAPQFTTGLLTPFDSFSLLTLPGDAGTWSVTVYISSRDQALKEVRHPEKWQAVVAACLLHAHLLDGEQVFGRPGFGDRVAAVAGGHEAFAPPGPSRLDLLKALA